MHTNNVIAVDFRHKTHRVQQTTGAGMHLQLPRQVPRLSAPQAPEVIVVVSLGFFNFLLACLIASTTCLLAWWWL